MTTTSRRPLVAGNWKMNGSAALAASLSQAVRAAAPGQVEVLLCPPFPYLAQVQAALVGSGVQLGAQDLAVAQDGAFTGEVSGAMLRDVGCGYVLVGHSERRTLYGETDAVVAEKFAAAQAQGLRPILCVGETLDEHEAGEAEAVVRRQLDAVLNKVGIAAFADAVVAYEPVWAIGTGLTATPAQAQALHAVIRAHLEDQDASVAAAVRLLYGGSVKADNAASLLAEKDIDGGLIGGASLDADSFLAICQAAKAD